MSTIEAILTVEPDGSAHIEAPIDLAVGRYRVSLQLPAADDLLDANGWPAGFFARTYGSCADDPLPEATTELPRV